MARNRMKKHSKNASQRCPSGLVSSVISIPGPSTPAKDVPALSGLNRDMVSNQRFRVLTPHRPASQRIPTILESGRA